MRSDCWIKTIILYSIGLVVSDSQRNNLSDRLSAATGEMIKKPSIGDLKLIGERFGELNVSNSWGTRPLRNPCATHPRLLLVWLLSLINTQTCPARRKLFYVAERLTALRSFNRHRLFIEFMNKPPITVKYVYSRCARNNNNALVPIDELVVCTWLGKWSKPSERVQARSVKHLQAVLL